MSVESVPKDLRQLRACLVSEVPHYWYNTVAIGYGLRSLNVE